MRILIDARFLGPEGTGIGRYVEKLLEYLQLVDKKNEYWVALRESNFDNFHPVSQNFHKFLVDVKWYTLKEQLVLPAIFASKRPDLLHVPHFNVPLLYQGKTVVTVHDLIKHEVSWGFSTTHSYLIHFLKRLGYRVSISQAVKHARAVIAPSNYVKEQVVGTFGIDPRKVYVTYEAGVLADKARTVQERGVEDVLGKYKISKPYLLYVGTVYRHKNVERLLDALKILNEELGRPVQLVLVGARDVFRERLAREIVQRGVLKYVTLTGYVTDADLVDLYREARAYVQPSLSEGFGLTSIEAMALGTPVVQSNASCLPEIGRDAAIYFDPYNPRDMAERLALVVGDEGLRNDLSKKGIKRAKEFSWEKMARETLAVYHKVSGK